MRINPAFFVVLFSLLAAVASANAAPIEARVPATGDKTPDEIDWETLEDSAPITTSEVLNARIDAAKRLAKRAAKAPKPEETAARFDALGSKYLMDAQVRRVLAECIGVCDSPETQKMLAKEMQSGQPFAQIFRLRAARDCEPGIVDEAALKLLSSKDAGVRREALDLLVRHKHAPALKSFEAILRSGKDTEMMGPAVEAISALHKNGEGWEAWEAQLSTYAASPNEDLRRSALSVLAAKQDAARLPIFLEALQHEDWATRAIALSWLVRSQSKEGVTAIIERYQTEPPDSRMAADCGDTLRKMTGQPLGDDPVAWSTWWASVKSEFKFPKAKGPKTDSVKRPDLASGTQAPQFYGIEVRSQRVIFVVDVSGSMKESMVGAEYEGQPRIDAARAELAKIFEALTPNTLFNIITFSDSVTPWLDAVDESEAVGTGNKGGARKGPSTGPSTGPKKPDTRDEKTRARDAEKQKAADELLRKKATEYVGRLNADGGTNIHDALEEAFRDESVDTIFFLSDGMPSSGKEVDPQVIRDVIQRWNGTRRLKINCIAIGQELPLLKWIAGDSGGEYKYFP